MSQITISNLTFGYEGSPENVFENVNLTLDTDWKLGLTGRNGRGKTTLLKILAGRLDYRGTVSASAGFDYFPFDVDDPSRYTGDLLESLLPEIPQWQILRELGLLGLGGEILWRPFETLSSGEQTKALIGTLFLRENRFLLIDEPTNHLDAAARETVAGYLASKKGFILVSHDRDFLDRCIDHILSINKTGFEVQKGNFSSWNENRERREKDERAENDRLKKDIRRLAAAARQAGRWSDKVEASKWGDDAYDKGHIGHMAAKMMKRSKTIETRRQKAAEQKAALLRDVETAERLIIQTLKHPKNLLIEARELSVSYDGRTVNRPVSFTVAQGERAALIGRNGAGKSSVLKLILGEAIGHSGTLSIAGNLTVSYVAQDTSFLCGTLRELCRKEGLDESLLKAILRKLDFSRPQLEAPVETYSGGQKKKVLIARSLARPAHLYLWDEPLNFIDVLSRIQIEELILAGKPTMLFVEHDAVFREKIATKTIGLE